MKNKLYIFYTIQQITNELKEDQIDNFIQDFSTWLKIAKTVRKDPVLGKAFISEYFKWIDDKKHDPILGLITPEKLEKVRRQRK